MSNSFNNSFYTISEYRLNALKIILKSFYMGEFMPYVEDLKGYYDYKLDPKKPIHRPGDVVSCTIRESISYGIHEFAVDVEYDDPNIRSGVEYWRLEDINKWIE